MELGQRFLELQPEMVRLRRWFHAHPEPSLKEEQTARQIAAELDALGIPHEALPPNHGLVAVVKGQAGGSAVALRADMDALPVTERTGLPFASQNPGFMHACGHDAHVAMLLGAARVLNETRNRWEGTVYCFFQPAEEIGQGHQEALDWLERRGGAGAVFGLHIWSLLPEGELLLLPGAVFAGVMSYIVTLTGRGGHGGRPDLVRDPIKAACDLVLKYAAIPTNFYDVLDPCVVNVGYMEAGTVGNVFPSRAKIHGGIRWFKPGGEERITDAMRRIAAGVGDAYGVECELSTFGMHPPVYNDPAFVERGRALAPQIQGLRLSAQTEPIVAGDNMSFYLKRYPGFYGILGAGKPGTEIFPHHHECFDIDESALRKGAEFLARSALGYLEDK